MAQAAQAAGFVVRPFAVMKLTHDAIRYQLDLFEAAFGNDNYKNLSNDDISKYEQDFKDLHRCINLHAKQENEVFFPKLRKLVETLNKDESTKKCFDEKSNENDKADKDDNTSFFKQHTIDDGERQAILKAFESKKGEDIAKTLMEWIKDHRQHLTSEEAIMMPLTPQTADTVEKRGAIVREILNIDRKEFNEFQFGFVLSLLVSRKKAWFRKDSGKNEQEKKMSKGSLKMYCLGTQMASNKDEYNQLKPIIKKTLEPADYDMFKESIEKDGKQ